MSPGLYDLTDEYITACPERRKEIAAVRAQRYPNVIGWPSRLGQLWIQFRPEVWGWAPARTDVSYLTNRGKLITHI